MDGHAGSADEPRGQLEMCLGRANPACICGRHSVSSHGFTNATAQCVAAMLRRGRGVGEDSMTSMSRPLVTKMFKDRHRYAIRCRYRRIVDEQLIMLGLVGHSDDDIRSIRKTVGM